MSRFDYKPFKEKIESYEKIIVLTHKAPDYDAMGSQLGLYFSLKATYPEKDIYAGGECKDDDFVHVYTRLEAGDYIGALVIFTDTPSEALVSDLNYKEGDYVAVMDHHFSRGDFGDLSFVDTSLISACLLVYDLIVDLGMVMNKEIAELLLLGLVSDSGRFRYKNTDKDTFAVVSALLANGADLQGVYGRIYNQSLAFVRHKGYVMSHFEVFNHHIGYIVHTKDLIEKSGLTMFEVTRGMVNSMADIEGIEAWANFTYTEDGVKAEFRSKRIPVVQVAKAFGGGGHELACGATLASDDLIEDCLKALNQVIEGSQQ